MRFELRNEVFFLIYVVACVSRLDKAVKSNVPFENITSTTELPTFLFLLQ